MRHLAIGEDREIRHAVAREPREPRSQLSRDEQHGRLGTQLLLARRVEQRTVQTIREARLERRAAVAALEPVAQQQLERRIERDHGQLVAQAVDALDDRAAERLAHVREQHGGVLRAPRVLGEKGFELMDYEILGLIT